MAMDYEAWRDGVGYDLAALDEASPEERAAIEALVLQHAPRDWRDVEALAALDTQTARKALTEALGDPDPQVRMTVVRHAPDLVSDEERTASLVRAIESAQAFEGLSAILDEAEAFHPRQVVEALLRGALGGDGEAAVHFAALLLFLHGQADEAFDWAHRPFFLRFNTDDAVERKAAFVDLCARIGVDPSSAPG